MLVQKINTKKVQISAFDLDRTLLNNTSSYQFCLYLCRKKILPAWSRLFIRSCQLKYTVGLLSATKLHKQAFDRFFWRKSESLICYSVEEFLEENFKRLLYAPALKKFRHAQEAGHLVVILSSSPNILVEPIARRLGVSLWDSTQYAVDKDRQFCHISRLMMGEDKAKFIENLCHQRKIALSDVTAYSDSYLDLPFLLAAGKAVGVNPDRRLRAICRHHSWPII